MLAAVRDHRFEIMPFGRQLLVVYDDLPPRDRLMADAYLEAHPEDRQLVEQGRRLQRLFRAASTESVAKDDLVTVLVARSTLRARGLESLSTLVSHVDKARERDPELDRQYRALESRLLEIARELPSGSEQFQRLMGEQSDETAVRRRRGAPSSPDRTSVRFARARVVAVGFATLAAAVALVALIDSTARPFHTQLAALHQLPETHVTPRLRGPELAPMPATERYDQALGLIRAGRQTTLGLFARYGDAELAQAAELLVQIADAEPRESALGLEARFVLARVYLHQREVERARAQLRMVVDHQGPNAPAAAELLGALDRQPADRPPPAVP